jgi:hypothetical protein
MSPSVGEVAYVDVATRLRSASLASRDGQLELVVSDKLPAELNRTLAYPKLRKRIPAEKAASFVKWVRDHATVAEDPTSRPPVASRDPGSTIGSASSPPRGRGRPFHRLRESANEPTQPDMLDCG